MSEFPDVEDDATVIAYLAENIVFNRPFLTYGFEGDAKQEANLAIDTIAERVRNFTDAGECLSCLLSGMMDKQNTQEGKVLYRTLSQGIYAHVIKPFDEHVQGHASGSRTQ